MLQVGSKLLKNSWRTPTLSWLEYFSLNSVRLKGEKRGGGGMAGAAAAAAYIVNKNVMIILGKWQILLSGFW